MFVNHRRGVGVAVALLMGAAVVGLLVGTPATLAVVQRVDDAVWRLAGDLRNGPTTAVAEAFSLLGSVWVNWPLRAAAAALLAIQRRFVQLAAFALAVFSSEVLIGTLKTAYARPRPLGGLIATSGDSFPSGHAIAGAVTAVGLVVVLLPPGRRWGWEVYAVVFSFVMAMSRVYLRAHWLSDTIAGGLLGAGLALGWPALLQTIRVRGRPRIARTVDRRDQERVPAPSDDVVLASEAAQYIQSGLASAASPRGFRRIRRKGRTAPTQARAPWPGRRGREV